MVFRESSGTGSAVRISFEMRFTIQFTAAPIFIGQRPTGRFSPDFGLEKPRQGTVTGEAPGNPENESFRDDRWLIRRRRPSLRGTKKKPLIFFINWERGLGWRFLRRAKGGKSPPWRIVTDEVGSLLATLRKKPKLWSGMSMFKKNQQEKRASRTTIHYSPHSFHKRVLVNKHVHCIKYKLIWNWT